METKAIRGFSWTFVGFAGNRVVSLTSTLVLARLLDPRDFGVFALSTLVVNLAGLLRDSGFGDTIVLRQDMTERQLGTVLSLMVLSAAVISLSVAAVAPLLALAFRDGQLTDILLALSPIVLLGGIAGFYEAMLQRELEFRRRFVCQLLQTVIYAGAAIALAAAGLGVWSLVVGQILAAVGFTVALVALAPRRVGPAWDGAAARDAVHVSRGFLAQGLVDWVSNNTDYIVIGRVLGNASLGIYSNAWKFADLIFWATVDPIQRVTFPAFSRMRHRGEDVRPAFLSVLKMVAFMSCPVGVLLSADAAGFTHALFGPKWAGMIGPLYGLGLWAALRSVSASIDSLLNSHGHAGAVGRLHVLVLVPFLPAVVVVAELWGIAGVGWMLLAQVLIALALLVNLARRRLGVSLTEQWRAVRPAAIGCAVCWLVTYFAWRGASSLLPALPAAGAAVVAGLAAYLFAVRLVDRTLIPEARRQVLRAVGRERPPLVAAEAASAGPGADAPVRSG